jgi:hypothetical protein
MKTNLLPRYPSALLLALGVSALCHAQTNPTSRVTVTHVKPEMVNEWIDLMKAEIPDLKKGGAKSRTVLQTYVLGNSYEYVTVSPVDNFAMLDGQPPLARGMEPGPYVRLNSMLRKYIDGSTSFLSFRRDEISNLVLNDAPPSIVIQARYRVSKMQEFINLAKSDLLPVYKNAGVRMTMSLRGVGANPLDVVISTYYKSFAEWGGLSFLEKQLGAEGAAKINAKFAGVRTLVEVVARRRVDGLSF